MSKLYTLNLVILIGGLQLIFGFHLSAYMCAIFQIAIRLLL